MMKESWLDIENWPKYKISNLGRVYSFKSNRCLKTTPHYKNKYLQVTLSKPSKIKTFRVHRIAADHFIPNPNNYLEVNHIDGNKNNNTISNLEWVTRCQNMSHARNSGLIDISGENNPMVKLTNIQVKQILNLLEFHTQLEVAKMFNISQTHVSQLFRGIRRSK